MNRNDYLSFFFCALLFWGLGRTSELQAQNVIESFEIGGGCNTNYHQNNAFSEGCVSDWIAVAGTPNVEMFEPVVEVGTATFTAFDGDYYARTFTGIWANCPGVLPKVGESMALEYPFKKCTDYNISFRLAKRTFDPEDAFSGELPVKVSVALANNLSNLPPPSNSCDYQQLSVTNNMQLLMEVNYPASSTDQEPVWSQRNTSFTSEEDYSHLIFIAEYQDNEVGGVYVYYDHFFLTAGDSPIFPDFYAAKEEDLSQEEMEFCHNEDVWICLEDADFQWDNTVFTVLEGLSDVAFSSTGVVMDIKANNCYNLSEMLRDNGSLALEVNQDYRIKMSVEHPDCGWVDNYFPITVVCCEVDIDASFTYELDLRSSPASLTANATTDYTNDGGTHEFCLYIDTDADGTIDAQVTCSSSTDFLFESFNPDWIYYLVHCVETACSAECEQVRIKPGLFPYCPNECTVSNFLCLQNFNQTYLYWSGSPDILSYDIEVYVNDPSCGCTGSAFVNSYSSDRSSIRLDITPNCFSYRVKTYCEQILPNGEILIVENWSPFQCATCSSLDVLVGDDPADPRSAATEKINPGTTMTINPNPFKSEFNLQLGAIDPVGAEVEIYTMDGKLVYHQQVLQNGVIDLSQLSYQGLLWVQVKVGDQLFNQKVLKL